MTPTALANRPVSPCGAPLARPASWRAAATLLAAAAMGACSLPHEGSTHVTGTSSPSGAPAPSPAAEGVGNAMPPLPPGRQVPTIVGRLAVRDTGPPPATSPGAEVIVLWPSILTDHRIYREPIRAWQDRHRLVIVDGPGHGGSGAAPEPFTMAQCGQALGQVLDALGIAQPVVVVGTSWGGLVAGEFALLHPTRTRAVVMLNTPVHTTPGGPGLSDRFVAWGARWIHATSLYRDGVVRAFFLSSTRERGGPVLEDFHRHLREADGAALATAVRAVLLQREALAPRMGGIAAPTLFVTGRHDAMYPLESLHQAASALPRGRFEVLDTAHISVVDAPAATTALIDAFLATLPAAGR